MFRQIYKSVGVAALVLFSCIVTYAQKQTVSGTIKDPTGGAMPGVNVLIKGTATGTSSDSDGKFSLQATPEDVLVISFIGYKTQEVLVGNQTRIDIEITEDLTTLAELVVVGYGVEKKTLSTGANMQVSGESLQKLSTTNVLQALQGQAPGVQITSTSGQPGEALKVLIRGIGTTGNSSPLYVVDGVLTGDVTYLNPADIASVSVLKDAASAAIYGSQAANGVVLINTKSGKAGEKSQITFDAFYGIQNVAKQAELLNSHEYATIMNEAAVNSGKLPYFTNDQIAGMGEGTNWINQMFVKDAPTQSYNFGATGGGQNSVFSTSLGYLSQDGIIGGADLSRYERYTFRINSEHKLYKDVIRIGQNLTFSYMKNKGIGVGNQYNNTLRGAFNTSPFVPMYDDEGNFYDNSTSSWNNGEANPYALMVYNNQNDKNNQKLLGNLYMEVEPIENLKFRTSLGIDYNAGEGHSFTPIYNLSIYAFNNDTRATQYLNKGQSMLWDNLISYGFNLRDDHRFDVMVGSSARRENGTSMYGSNTDLVFSDLEHAWLTNATNKDGAMISLTGAPWEEVNLMSYFGRLNYNYKETYLLNTTFRADGSSRFIGKNRWGYFPSVSAGWVISNTELLDAVSDKVNFLKLRASWGQVGNQNIGNFQYMAPVTFANTNYNFGPEEAIQTPGAYVLRLANPDIRWEASEQTNIGIDATLFTNFKLTFDWYTKTSKDWLIRAPILGTAGAEAPYINGGNAVNKGIELALNYNNTVGALDYSIGINGSYNQNEVEQIPTQDGIIHGNTNELYANAGEFYRAQSGFPMGYFWGLQTNGLFQTEEDVNNNRSNEGIIIQPDAQPGDVRYVDRNNDGQISDADRTMIGNPNPDFVFGFNVAANYKGFDLNIQGNGVAGNELVQSYRNHSSPYSNYTTEILDRWHGPGSSNRIPRVTENNSNWTNFSDLYIYKGDFLRLSNVTLGYDFGQLIKSDKVSQVRLYVSALNLATFTNYPGMDPEIGFGPVTNSANGDGKNSFSSGVDVGYYPRPRTYMVGLNVKF
jgi:TonB-dependent starch-binding outer membrane protein SusC